MTVAALGTVDAGHSGMASGVNNTARQVGIAAGIAGFGAVLQAGISGGVSAGMAARGVPAAVAAEAGRLAAAGDVPGAGRALGAAGRALPGVYDAAFTSALHTVFIAAIGIVALGALLTVALVRPARAAGTASIRSRPRARTSTRSSRGSSPAPPRAVRSAFGRVGRG